MHWWAWITWHNQGFKTISFARICGEIGPSVHDDQIFPISNLEYLCPPMGEHVLWHVRGASQCMAVVGAPVLFASHMISWGSYRPWATAIELSDLVSATRARARLKLLAWNHILNGSHLFSEINFRSRVTWVRKRDFSDKNKTKCDYSCEQKG